MASQRAHWSLKTPRRGKENEFATTRYEKALWIFQKGIFVIAAGAGGQVGPNNAGDVFLNLWCF